MNPIKIIYIANILVAGWISFNCLLSPKSATAIVFTNDFQYSEAIRLVGALWFAIFALSVLGLFFPQKMALVLVFQLIYKSTWLLVAAIPAMINNQSYPKSMAAFFLVWVLILPFVIPWKSVFS